MAVLGGSGRARWRQAACSQRDEGRLRGHSLLSRLVAREPLLESVGRAGLYEAYPEDGSVVGRSGDRDHPPCLTALP